MRFLLLILLLSFNLFAQEELVEDSQILKEVQKLLIDNGFTTSVKLPQIIYYKTPPQHFQYNWVGLTKLEKGTIEILVFGNKQFDLDTFYHECYHWFVADDLGKSEPEVENRANRFAKLCIKYFKNRIPKGIVIK